MNKYLSRKLWLSVFVIAVASWARTQDYVDGPQFVTLVLGAFGGYTWANVQATK